MKKIIFLLLFITNSFALEIQCFSEDEGIHSTIIKEENTDRYFVLFDDGENFLNYLQLEPQSMSISEDSFSYEDSELKIQVSLENEGQIESLSPEVILGKEYSSLSVSACKFVSTDL
jgi:hypothetical protein